MSANVPPPPKSHLVITTRGSMLALWQANYVTSLLEKFGVTCEKLVLKTTADRIQDRFLHELGGKGLFVKELEQALVSREADLAVHSLKDMPAQVAGEFSLATVIARHQPTDLLILGPKLAAQHQKALPAMADADFVAKLGRVTIGTGSLRRQAILRRHAPQVACVPIRGNVDTRLRKLQEGTWDAIILAEASIERLGIQGLTSLRLDPSWFVPCAGQGALALETRADDSLAPWLAKAIGCADTFRAITLERLVLSGLGGDCQMPFGCYAVKSQSTGRWSAQAVVYDLKGAHATAHGSWDEAHFSPHEAAADLAKALKAAGAKAVLESLAVAIPEIYQ